MPLMAEHTQYKSAHTMATLTTGIMISNGTPISRHHSLKEVSETPYNNQTHQIGFAPYIPSFGWHNCVVVIVHFFTIVHFR